MIDGQVCNLAKKSNFLTIFDAKFIYFFSKVFFFKQFSIMFFYAEFKSFIRFELLFARYFNCTEPHNRFL